jgi:hypothetical protein
VGVSAYLGAVASIQNKDYLTAAGTIVTVEARHNTYLIGNNGGNPVPAVFDTPLNFREGLTLASQFIVRCPSDNPTLPIEALPTLQVVGSPNVAAGESIEFSGQYSDPASAIILFDARNTSVPLQDNRFTVPTDSSVDGAFYVVVSSDGSTNDDQVVAGPAILVAQNDWLGEREQSEHVSGVEKIPDASVGTYATPPEQMSGVQRTSLASPGNVTEAVPDVSLTEETRTSEETPTADVRMTEGSVTDDNVTPSDVAQVQETQKEESMKTDDIFGAPDSTAPSQQVRPEDDVGYAEDVEDIEDVPEATPA